MNFKEVKELIELINSSQLAFFEIESADGHIKMDKSLSRGASENKENDVNVKNKPEPTAEKPERHIISEDVKKIKKEESKEEKIEDSNLRVITSPMVGTFYASASPDAPAFVKPGDVVSKGKVICIIEAMKLMNEINSDVDGEVVDILVSNEDLVEYNQAIFKIKTI